MLSSIFGSYLIHKNPTCFSRWSFRRMKDYNAETQLGYEEMIAFIDEIRAYADLEVVSLDDVLWVYQTSGQLYSTKAK